MEDVWGVLQDRHLEIPDTVIVLGTGVKGAKLHKLGHWLPRSWRVDSVKTGEFLLAGEALVLGAEKVLEIVIHEAAHALGEARNIQDTSRNGRFHNKKFRDLAEELGLKVSKQDPYGYAATDYLPLPQDEGMIALIRDALTLERPVLTKPKEESASTTHKVECKCPRRLRISTAQMDAGPLICGVCDSEFKETE